MSDSCSANAQSACFEEAFLFEMTKYTANIGNSVSVDWLMY